MGIEFQFFYLTIRDFTIWVNWNLQHNTFVELLFFKPLNSCQPTYKVIKQKSVNYIYIYIYIYIWVNGVYLFRGLKKKKKNCNNSPTLIIVCKDNHILSFLFFLYVKLVWCGYVHQFHQLHDRYGYGRYSIHIIYLAGQSQISWYWLNSTT